jgi:DNA (cytosine-5)-methyltransferase 1
VRLVGGDGQTVGALAAQPGMKQTTYLATGSHWDDPSNPHPTLNQSARGSGGIAASNQEIFSQRGGGLVPSQPTMQVRRLLPIECEFLQGFPADWTLIPWKGKPASECPDGPRYKSMGNSMAVPVMRWIGTRLDALVKGTL